MVGRDDYALKAGEAGEVSAPDLDYLPPHPARPHRTALIGAGGISFAHLDAYRSHRFDVAVILSRDRARAEARRDEFFPQAEVMTDYAALLARNDIEVVDLTPHPAERLPLIEAALQAGKHVLSQKPFVTDLDTGERLCAMAEARGLHLAVNQNGRWAPHLGWMRAAVRAGLVGQVMSVHVGIHWDHRWIAGTPFAALPDVVMFDFGVHWFDFVTSVMRRPALRAQAQAVAGSKGLPPLLASALLDFGVAQPSLVFDAATLFGPQDSTYIAGTMGSLIATGPDLGRQSVALHSAAGVARPVLQGQWFNDGFAGAMGALLVAIETGVPPENAARGNLDSLANTFAALQAARTGQAAVPGQVRSR